MTSINGIISIKLFVVAVVAVTVAAATFSNTIVTTVTTTLPPTALVSLYQVLESLCRHGLYCHCHSKVLPPSQSFFLTITTVISIVMVFITTRLHQHDYFHHRFCRIITMSAFLSYFGISLTLMAKKYVSTALLQIEFTLFSLLLIFILF